VTGPALLAGVLIALAVFASLRWSVARSFQISGVARLVHGAHAALIILAMATISLAAPGAGRLAGALLVVTALAAAWSDRRWNRLLPLFAGGFGLALALGLPFA